jgi:hypothetical protein
MQGRKATYVEKTPEDVYRDVAQDFEQFTPEDIAAIGGLESEHGKYASPLQGGSARGLFQFQPQTAEYLEPGSSESLNDMNTQAALMKKYLQKTDQQTPEDAYMLHSLGPNRGQKFLDADDSELVSRVIPERVRRANPSLYKYKTVGEAKAAIKNRLKAGQESSEMTPNIKDLIKGE